VFKAMSTLAAVLWLSGCARQGVVPAAEAAVNARVTGTVSYMQRIALPPTALIKVQLADVSRADAPADVLGEQVIQAAGKQVPFTFEIGYDPARIDARHTYAIQARIEVDGKLRFVSDQLYAVITHGAPMHSDMVLHAVDGRVPR
jgi:putative lipoprotein